MTQTTSDQLAPTLTASDLKGFDPRQKAFVREMESYGWRGRRGSKNHVLMRAPDGVTMCTVTRKSITRNDQCNQTRIFRAWLRQQEVPAVVPVPTEEDDTAALAEVAAIRAQSSPVRPDEAISQPAPEPEIEPVPPVDTAPEPCAMRNAHHACPECGREFAGAQPLSVHHVRVHVKVGCPICDQQMSPGNLPRHLRKHAADLGTHEQVMREVLRLRAELARAHTEASEWERMADEIEDRYTAVKGRLDNAVGYLLGD